MKFIHIADLHLGADPDIGSARRGKREREIWESLERVLKVCEEQRIELLLIAGDVFHRQPLKRELKELNYLFSQLSFTKVVMIAGNHDYVKKESYYRTFPWAENVHMLLAPEISCVEFPEYSLAVYGFSYHEREIKEERYKGAFPQRRQAYEILLAHGGDSEHIPMKREDLLELGYDYIALGHIHKPQQICPGKIAYAGALEPIDKNDTGSHGYVLGEITTRGCQIRFIPAASREYVHMEVPVEENMTAHEVRDELRRRIAERGEEHIYKVRLTGRRDPETVFDLSGFDTFGNIIELSDDTNPAYCFGRLKERNRDNILGQFIASMEGCGEDSVEYQALCEGVHALMETRRGR